MTTNPWYAGNARDLLDMRRQSLRPERPVNVSLMGSVPDENLTLYVRDGMPAERLDWRMLVNLDAIVWADTGTPFDRLTTTLWRIAQARPHGLQLCFLHADAWHLIDLGSGYHLPAVADVPALHEFLWCPLNFGGTAYGHRLRTAITKTHKTGVTL